MAHNPHHHDGAFAAKADAPPPGDGLPVFEMPADSSVTRKPDDGSNRPSRAHTPEPQQPVQANPWPFYLENPAFLSKPAAEEGDDDAVGDDAKGEQDNKSSAPPPQANPWPWHGPQIEGDAPSATVYPTAASSRQGSEERIAENTAGPRDDDSGDSASQAEGVVHAPEPTQPPATEPLSLGSNGDQGTASLFPAPLKLSNKPRPCKSASPQFKPYSPPPESDARPAPLANAPSGRPHSASTTSIPYRPYRPPSLSRDEATGEAWVTQPSTTRPSPGPAYQAYSVGAAPHHFYNPLQTSSLPSSPLPPTDAPLQPAPAPAPALAPAPIQAEQAQVQAHHTPQSPPPPSQTPTALLNALPTVGLSPSPQQQQQVSPVASPPPPPPQQPPVGPVVPFAQPQYAAAVPAQQYQHAPITSPIEGVVPPTSSPTAQSPVLQPSEPAVSTTQHQIQPPESASAFPPTSGYNIPQKTYAPQHSQSDFHLASASPLSPPPPPYQQGAFSRPGSQPPATTGYPSPYQPPPSQALVPARPQFPDQPTYAPANSLQPPPLPPRPVSANGVHPSGSYNPSAYPPPPKTYYTPAPALPPRPGAGKLFNSSAAKKWFDKTNHVLESTLAPILPGLPDHRYRSTSGGMQRLCPLQHQPPHQASHHHQGQGPMPGAYPRGSSPGT